MGWIHFTGFAWMAYAGLLICSSTMFVTLAWRGKFQKRLLNSTKMVKHSFVTLRRSGRSGRLRRFESIAHAVVTDVTAALQPPLCHHHARSFLPIVSDVRRRGQSLLDQQTTAHRVSSPEREKSLKKLVLELFSLETQLKALPKHTVTMDDVLSGKFD